MMAQHEVTHDEKFWQEVSEVVLQALRRNIGWQPDPLEAEQFVASAIGTALRREADEGLDLKEMSRDEMVRWLIIVARRKWIDAVRHAAVERRGAAIAARNQTEISEVNSDKERAKAEATEVLDRLFKSLTAEEQIVVAGRLDDKTLAQIADELRDKVAARKKGCSQQTVSNIFCDIIQRWRRDLGLSDE
jgi:DNA-directed RNA polymerase specialized sigma24 family protein